MSDLMGPYFDRVTQELARQMASERVCVGAAARLPARVVRGMWWHQILTARINPDLAIIGFGVSSER